MSTKLTLTIESEIIEAAKKYAAGKGKSLSSIVENYLKSLSIKSGKEKVLLSPRVRQLKGIVHLPDNIDYKEILTQELLKKHLK